jgi:transcriptional regulator GlxA family with amidase domain
VCAGAGLAAKTAVLDGKGATMNMSAWDTITSYSPNTIWVHPVRWVVDGNIWSSCGVGLFSFHSVQTVLDRCAISMVCRDYFSVSS